MYITQFSNYRRNNIYISKPELAPYLQTLLIVKTTGQPSNNSYGCSGYISVYLFQNCIYIRRHRRCYLKYITIHRDKHWASIEYNTTLRQGVFQTVGVNVVSLVCTFIMRNTLDMFCF